MRVTQMINRTGRPVANQFVITDNMTEIFQSYETKVAKLERGVLTLDNKVLEYSQTTSKYLYMFTGLNKQQIVKGLKSGEIKTADLN